MSNHNNYSKQFKNDGFILLKDFFTVEEADLIKTCADNLYNLPEVRESYMKFYENTKDQRILSRMEYFINSQPELKNLVDTKVTPILKEIMNQNMCLFKDKINWKLPGGGKFKPHQDNEAWSDFPPTYYITCAFSVDNCTIENGCLEMVRGEHTKGILKNNNGCLDKEIVDNLEWEPMLTTTRDLIAFDSFVPHRSDINHSNNARRIFYFTYNRESEGSYYEDYFKKKRIELPPDFEREENKEYNLNSKYNLANPIS